MNHDLRRPSAKRGQSAPQRSSVVRQLFAAAEQHRRARRLDDASACYRKALDLAPNDPDTHSNLGAMLGELGQLDEAVACFRRAIDLNPDYPGAYSNLGVALRQWGRLDAAVTAFRRAIDLKPDYVDAITNLGAVLEEQGQLDEAALCLRRAVTLIPDNPYAHRDLGCALGKLGRLDEATVCLRRAIEIKPDYADASLNLGAILAKQARLEEAAACFRRTIELKPSEWHAHNNLGVALQEQDELDEAAACCERAISLKPDFAEAYSNLGVTLRRQGHLDQAITCYQTAITLNPGLADAHFDLAMALLARGEMTAGWEEYEWRWKTPDLIRYRRTFAQPQWRGEAAAGRTLLIHADQGFGDTLQFCRYARLAAARGLRVVMEVQRPLFRLLRSLACVDQLVAHGDELPPFDLHCPMLSMPLALRTTLTTIPAGGPYLHADAAKTEAWRRRLAAMPNQGPRIGLVWAGTPQIKTDRRRSVAPGRLAPLFNQAGLHFFSLQKDGPVAPAEFRLTDFMDEMEDFADTAALITNLDLVISVDTSVVHLASALGKPVWMMDRFDSEWRWLTGRRDSPWYPTLRLYRQPSPGDWDTVLAEVCSDLRTLFPFSTDASHHHHTREIALKLNLGCGQNKMAGYVNVDKYDSFAPDVVWNLESFPWPFESDSVEEIILSHCLEHMGASVDVFLLIMQELYRICIPNGKILIAVPHPRHDVFANDPTHVRVINPAMFTLFSKKKNRECRALGSANTPLATYIDVDFEMINVQNKLSPHWAKQMQTGLLSPEALDFAVASYYNVVEEITLTLIACK